MTGFVQILFALIAAAATGIGVVLAGADLAAVSFAAAVLFSLLALTIDPR